MARNGWVTVSAENEIKLALGFFFLILLAADLLSIFSLVHTRRMLAEEQAQRLQSASRAVVARIASTPDTIRIDAAKLREELASLAITGFASTYDQAGFRHASASTAGSRVPVGLFPDRLNLESLSAWEQNDFHSLTQNFGDETYFVRSAAIVPQEGSTGGYLVLAIASNVGRSLSNQLIAAFQLAVVLLCLPLILYLSRWFTLPYREIRKVVAENGIQLPEGSDLRRRMSLAAAFRGIVEQLRTNEHELERLHDLERRRAESFESLSTKIVESIPTGLIGFDRQGKTIISNEQAHRIFGVQSLGRAASDTQMLQSFFRCSEELISTVSETLASGRTFHYRELSVNTGEKGHRMLGVSISPIGKGYSDIQGALCLVSDVTAINELKERIKVREYLSSLGEMAAGLAHEFKNSLATIHGFAQLLQSSNTKAETSAEIAVPVINETQHLTRMVTDFLNFARPQRIQSGSVDLNELVQDCSEEIAPLLESSRVRFTVAGPLPGVRGDRMLLRHALLNLLRNAVESIPEESTLREVTLRTQIIAGSEATETIELEVSDTGCGIAPCVLPKVFVPFFTTKERGHGIGLALVQKIVSGHDGTIHVESTVGKGTTFYCRLPVGLNSKEALNRQADALADESLPVEIA